MSIVGPVAVTLIANTSGFIRDIKKVEKRLTRFQRTLRFVGRSLRALGRGFRVGVRAARRFGRAIRRVAFSSRALLLAMVGVAGSGGLVAAAIKFAAEFDTAAFSLDKLLGSAEKGKILLADIQKLTIATPFRFEELLEGARALSAFGVVAEKIVPTIRAIGDAAAAVGGDSGKFQRLVQAYGKIIARTRITIRQLETFTRAGVPILPELAKVLGISPNEVLQAITDMQVQSGHFERALANMTKTGMRFSGMMIDMSKRTLGLFQSLGDAFKLEFLLPLGAALIESFKLNEAMASIIEKMQKGGGSLARTLAVLIKEAFFKVVDIFEKVAFLIEFTTRLARTFFKPSFIMGLGVLLGKMAFAAGKDFVEGMLSKLAGFFTTLGTRLKAALQIVFGPALGDAVASILNALGTAFGPGAKVGGNLQAITKDINKFVAVSGIAPRTSFRFFDGFRKWFDELGKGESVVSRVFDTILEGMLTLDEAIVKFGALGPSPTKVIQELDAAISRMAGTLADFGKTGGQKFLATLQNMVQGLEGNAEVMAKFGEGLRLALALSIQEAESLLGKTRALRAISIAAVGAVGPGTSESARLRFASDNPVFKVEKQIANNTLKTAVKAAALVTGQKDMIQAINDLAAASTQTIGGP